jgi:hypothetical protein
MTKAEIQRQIDELEIKQKKLNLDFSDSDDHKLISNQISSMEDVTRKLYKSKITLEEKIRENRKDEIDLTNSDLQHLYSLLNKSSAGLDPKDYSDELQKMFKAFYDGTTSYKERQLFWVDDSEKFAIFRIKPHSTYIGGGSGSKHVESKWVLYKISENFNTRSMNQAWSVSENERDENCLWWKSGGRWNKDSERETMIAVINCKEKG